METKLHDEARIKRNSATSALSDGYVWAGRALSRIATELDQHAEEPDLPREKVSYIDLLGAKVADRPMWHLGTYLDDDYGEWEFYLDDDGTVVYWQIDPALGVLPAVQLGDLSGKGLKQLAKQSDGRDQLARRRHIAEFLVQSEHLD